MRGAAPLVVALLAACDGGAHAVPPPRERPVTTTSETARAPAATSDVGSGARLRMLEASPEDDVISLIRARRLAARAEGRVLVVYAGATWCEPCKRFRAGAVQRASGSFAKIDLLVFDADRDRDRLAAAGYVLTQVPFAALPGGDGAPAEKASAPERPAGYGELLARVEGWGAR